MEEIKQLRKRTNAGVMDCKEALKESNGDVEEAIKILRSKGSEIAAEKSEREAKEGCIGCYLHSNNKLGALVELNCETDFVGKNPEFKDLAKEIAMQVAARDPKYISKEDVLEEVKEEEIENIKSEIDLENKPEDVKDDIIEGKLEKFYEQICLLNQTYIKDEDMTVKQLIEENVAKFGENIQISRMTRYEIGE